MLHLSKLPFRRSSNNEIGFEIITYDVKSGSFASALFVFKIPIWYIL